MLTLSPLSRHRLSLVRRKILVLDLDETLIHSHHDGVARQMVAPGTPPDFILRVNIDRHPVRFFVHKRPHVDFFLDVVSQWYELVVFTASMEIYGAAVADQLDGNRQILRRRYFRQHCTLDYGSYTKDLSAISNDLSSIFILDNSPGAYRAYPGNSIATDLSCRLIVSLISHANHTHLFFLSQIMPFPSSPGSPILETRLYSTCCPCLMLFDSHLMSALY